MAKGGTCRCAAVVLVTLLLMLLAKTADANLALRLVQVIHRHGARSPAVSYNKSKLCSDVPCGHLNDPGKKMLLSAGKFLREYYMKNFSGTFFPENYNVTAVYSRSSDYPRTLQSAYAFLHGLFSNVPTVFPAVHTIAKVRDLLLYTANFPFIKIFYKLDDEWKQEVCNPQLDKFIDFKTLLEIAKEVYSEGFCADASKRCSCAVKLFDIGAAFAADGKIKSYGLLKEHLDNLRSVVQFLFAAEFGHNASDKDNAKMGSKGQTFAQELLENAELHMQGKGTYKFYHYSAHDITLSALAGTLGDTTHDAVLPPFGQLYVFELLYNETKNAYSMRVKRGAPGQTLEKHSEFNWDTFHLKCMDESGSVYRAKDNICPYHDFKRFVDFSKPKDPAGMCYLNDRYKGLLKCPTNNEEPLNSYCKAAREVCPAWSCEPGFTLDSVTLQCVCSSASCMDDVSGGVSAMSAGSVAAIALTMFAIGVIISACVALFLNALRAKGRTATNLDPYGVA